MAKKYVPGAPKADKYTAFPSPCGSHQSMVDEAVTKELNKTGFVVCKDTFGHYITENKNLDNKMADPYRNSSPDWRNEQLAQNGLEKYMKKVEVQTD